MTITINGTTGISGVDGSSSTPSYKGSDSNTGISFGTDTVTINTGGSARVTVDSSGAVGIGTNAPTSTFEIVGWAQATTNNVAGAGLRIKAPVGNATPSILQFTNNEATVQWGSIGSPSVNVMTFFDSGAEIARFSSGNFGIGRTPINKLDVEGRGRFVQDAAATTGALVLRQNSGDTVGAHIQWVNNSNAAQTGYMLVDTSSNMIFATVASERMRLDSSGNLGLGVTPSAWGASFKALQISGQSALWSSGAGTFLSSNNYNDGNNKYIGTGNATRYYQLNGQHVWEIAPSGTAGNTISFTQAMTLDANSNLTVLSGAAQNDIIVNNVNTNVSASNKYGFVIQELGTENVSLRYFRDGTGQTKLTTSGALLFLRGATELGRFDSSGNLLLGGVTTSATGSRFRIRTSGSTNSTYGVFFENSSTTRLFAIEDGGTVYTGDAASSPYNNTTGSAANVFVSSVGILFRSTSSLKYKKEVNDATHGLAEVMQLRPVTYKGKSESDGDRVFGGLIAEEVHAAGLTEFVQYAEDGSPDALNYGNMVSLAFKAIQELKAEVDSLNAAVQKLKAQGAA